MLPSESAGQQRGASKDKKDGNEAEEVSPPEDLMREHGVFKRMLLVYGAAIRRIDARTDFPPETICVAGQIIRAFIEDYHEELENMVDRVAGIEKRLDIYDLAKFTPSA